MAITLPKYGTVVPSPTTRMRDLGRELQEFGESVESILESFDYNGADPNLVLSRMSALEIEAANLSDRADAIELELDALNHKTRYKGQSLAADLVNFQGATVSIIRSGRVVELLFSGWGISIPVGTTPLLTLPPEWGTVNNSPRRSGIAPGAVVELVIDGTSVSLHNSRSTAFTGARGSLVYFS